ncbi:MAG: GGDEF domain-containing protein [Candidatus Omnitrophota bacterium]
MQDFLEYKNIIPKPIILLAGFIAVILLGFTDYITGYELSFSVFYLIPISFVTILSGFSSGMIISVLSAATWLIADLTSGAHYSNFLIPYWNTFVRLGYFSLQSFLLSKLLSELIKSKDRSLRDSLTGAPNWIYFEEFSAKEIRKARREKKPLTVVYIDLDNFKGINDTMGHDIGDYLLRTITDIIQSGIRPNDIMARVGGDEFAILLTELDYGNANHVLLRLKDNIIKEMNSNNWPVTISMGAITYRTIPGSIETLIKQTDGLMYSVKNGGKNDLKHNQWPTQSQDEG